jgi:hypothetical protein
MPKFSISSLLTITTVIAFGIAIGVAYRQKQSMVQQRDELRSLSSRLQVVNEDQLTSAEMPRVADDFHSWNVHVPDGQAYELRLGIGEVSEYGIPPVAGSVPISAGQHRVTLYTGDSRGEEFQYVVYLDGEQVIEKSMGSEWMPNGWSSSSGMSWPREPVLPPVPLHLTARSYTPQRDFGNDYFNGQSDNWVSRLGFRLWIDQPDRSYEPASPFIGFTNDSKYYGIGLRDGLRYGIMSRGSYEWTFTRPSLDATEPVLRIAAEFFAGDDTILSSQTPSFQSWQLRNEAIGEDSLNWQPDPAQTVYSAFLHAICNGLDMPPPVVEMQWDTGRSDEVGLRLAETPANDRITRWRLRVLDGTKFLWRELQLGDRKIDADQVRDQNASAAAGEVVSLDIERSAEHNVRIQWRAAETLPLQIVQRKQDRYAGLELYRGLPMTAGIEIPAALNPTLAVKLVTEDPNAPAREFPEGPVFDEVQVDLEAAGPDWIWLKVKSKE